MFDIIKFTNANSEYLSAIYGENKLKMTNRIQDAVVEFSKLYGSDDNITVFSVAGRSEICGNHTDHNFGEVFAASIDLDIIAIARKNNSNTINLKSKGFNPDIVDITKLDVVDSDKGRSQSLIRGVCDGFVRNGHKICGFDCYTTSNVFAGSGLSSSAAFEVMIGNILNHFENEGKIDYLEVSKIAQYAENVHFGKPSGLMDQVACAAGGFVHIDFADPNNTICDRIPFDIEKKGYALCIVSTGGSHADLTDDYASVPAEMKKIAEYFGKKVLREVSKDDVIKNIPTLRNFASDRAILRAIHFYNENERVERMKDVLENNNMDDFLAIINESGLSSCTYLQNYFSSKSPTEQGITLACAVAKEILAGKGAVRVHGGGFAGTIQAFVPKKCLDEFKDKMSELFGKDSVTVLTVRPYGALKFN
ncbi:MAG: galactokinase [Clostridia bacterium]|nr:galactokinase [Clostridia bacterium]